MRMLWLMLILSAAVLIVACQPIQPATPTPDEPDDEATVQPASEAEATGTPAPEEEEGEELPEIAVTVRQHMAEERGIAEDEISVVSVEEVEWPDSCLGVTNPDEMCAQVITPGYRVVLEAGGEEVEYHTDLEGNSIRLATDTATGASTDR